MQQLQVNHEIKKMFCWSGLKTDVELFVKQCAVCQQAKSPKQYPSGLLHPLPVPAGAWQDLTMDFIEKLPRSEGYDTILVVVDRFTKYAHFFPLKHPFTAQGVAQIMVDSVIKLHGVPKTVVSDRDKIFTSVFWEHLFKLLDIKLALSTTYHPQTDGQSERVNQCLEMYLRCVVHSNPQKWKSWLSLAELWYNTTFHSSLGCSPFQALYGYEAFVLGIPLVTGQEDKGAVQFVQHRAEHIEMLKANLARAQQRYKHFADKKRVPREFQVGEHVLLKLQPYAQNSMVNRPCPEFAFKYFGPYTVTEKIGPAAYRLALPPEAQIHPVFHVSQLKPFVPNYTPGL